MTNTTNGTNGTDSRFSLIEIDDIKPAPAPKGVAPLPSAIAGQETDTSKTHGDIDEVGRERAIAAGLVAAKHGLIPNEATFFSWGTRGQWGSKAADARAQLGARPLFSELAHRIGTMIGREDRRRDTLALPELRYSDKDLVGRAGKLGIKLTKHAFGQLLARANAAPYAAAYLGDAVTPAAMRADHVGYWLKNANEQIPAKPAKGTRPAEPARVEPITGDFLTKCDSDGARYAYAIVSGKYTRYDLNDVVRDLLGAEAVPSMARGSLAYNPESTRWRLDIALGAQFEPVVGDIHRVTLRVRGSDAGAGSISVELFAERARCLNFSKVRLRQNAAQRVRHAGDVRGKVVALLDVQAEALQDFATVWAEANEQAIIDTTPGDARDVFRALIAKGYVSAPEGEEIAVERFFNAWLKEPGQTRAAYVNALTRAAHEAPWSNPWAGEELEDQASELLYNHVVLSA